MYNIKQVNRIAIAGPSRWGIDGILAGLTLLWGGPGVGKSFVAVSMAVSIATGRPWMGRRTREGTVLYIAGEGGEENVAHRVRAALREWSIDLDHEDYYTDVPFYILTPGMDLVKGGGQVLDLVERENITSKISLIVVDTLSRCFVGDENKQEFMAEFVRTLDYLRSHYQCDILVIHHANKQHELRGSSVLFGAVDVSWHLTPASKRDNDNSKMLNMAADKLRERPSEDARMQVRAAVKELVGPQGKRCLDEFGDIATTLVIKPTTKQMERIKEVRDMGDTLIRASGGSVTYHDWRAAMPKMNKQTFDTALSYVVTYPGRWGIMRGYRVGTYTKAIRGEEYHWSVVEA